jgi:hypothetical protein
MTALDASFAEMRQIERDLAYIRDRLDANPHDQAARRWEAMELAHLERVESFLRSCGATL